jgi:hypothetical protein
VFKASECRFEHIQHIDSFEQKDSHSRQPLFSAPISISEREGLFVREVVFAKSNVKSGGADYFFPGNKSVARVECIRPRAHTVDSIRKDGRLDRLQSKIGVGIKENGLNGLCE